MLWAPVCQLLAPTSSHPPQKKKKKKTENLITPIFLDPHPVGPCLSLAHGAAASYRVYTWFSNTRCALELVDRYLKQIEDHSSLLPQTIDRQRSTPPRKSTALFIQREGFKWGSAPTDRDIELRATRLHLERHFLHLWLRFSIAATQFCIFSDSPICLLGPVKHWAHRKRIRLLQTTPADP